MKRPSSSGQIVGKAALENFAFEHQINRANAGSGDLNDQILSASVSVVKYARDLAGNHPESIFAQARLIPLEAAADNDERANAAALAVLKSAKALLSKDLAPMGPSLRMAVDRLILSNCTDHIEQILEEFPQSAVVDELRAQIKVETRDFESALSFLQDSKTLRGRYLEAVCFYELGMDQSASSRIRSALLSAPKDVDLLLLAHHVFGRLGSRAKSKRYLQQALSLEPGRRDVIISWLRDAIESGELDRARSILTNMKKAKIVFTPDLLLLEAQCASLLPDHRKAMTLLREAAVRAHLEGDDKLQANVEANLFWYQFLTGQSDSSIVREKIRALASAYPKESYIVRALIGVSSTRADGLDAASLVDSDGGPLDPDIRDSSLAHLHFLCGHYRDSIAAAERAWLKDPDEPSNASLLMLLVAQFGSGDIDVRLIVQRTQQNISFDELIANASAYLLAVSGYPEEGLRVLNSVRPFNDIAYVLMATNGLALIANGEFDNGMRLYRQAAEVADEQPARPGRALMTLHQAAALRRLPLPTEAKAKISALALPETPLPSNWENDPSFLLMKAVADLKGWNWPIRPI